MNEPTGKQREEFWKLCGLIYRETTPEWALRQGKSSSMWWLDPEGCACSGHGNKPPPIDNNNLFEYAVPKLKGLQQIILQPDIDGRWYLGMTVDDKLYENIGFCLADALFRVIYKVFEENNAKKED